MIALIIVLCAALQLVTLDFLWLWVVIASAFVILIWSRQWFEFGVSVLLLMLVVLFPTVEPLTEKLPTQQVELVITSVPTTTASGCRAYGQQGQTRWLVTQRKDTCELRYGERQIVEATPVPISGLQNFQLFDRQQFYVRQKQVVGELQVQTLIASEVANWRYEQQQQLLTWLEQRLPDETVFMLVKTMLLGETSTFDEDVRTAWQTLNISHILAISGLHAAVFIGLLQFCFRKLHVTKQWQPWLIGGLLIILRIYNFASVSFTRIVCMWFVSLVLGKRLSQYHKLTLAILIIAVIWPAELFGIGFYYSFTCAFLLTLGHKLWRSKWSLVTLPLTLQIWLLPVTLWQTGQFLPISLLANMLAIPFISLLVPMLFLVIAIPSLSPVIVWFYTFGVNVFDWLLTHAGLTIVLGQLSLFACFCLAFLTLGIYRAQEHRKWLQIILIACCFVFIINFASRADPEVTMIDIGQGDALAVIDERKRAFVIDTGGPMKIEERHYTQETVVETYLQQRGVQVIETLVISHADADHLGYAFALFQRGQLQVENLVLATAAEQTPEEQLLIELATLHGSTIHFVQAGATIQFGALQFHVLAPFDDQRTNINDHSLVLYSQIGQFNWLFTGDIEKNVERALVQTYPTLAVDILKVAHHGSKTSSSELFLQTYQPKIGLISAGKNNRFNHPHPDIIARLHELGITTKVTSDNGMIRYHYQNNTWECKNKC